MPTFEAPDFYQLDELLTSEERQIRDAVRQWVDKRFRRQSSNIIATALSRWSLSRRWLSSESLGLRSKDTVVAALEASLPA